MSAGFFDDGSCQMLTGHFSRFGEKMEGVTVEEYEYD